MVRTYDACMEDNIKKVLHEYKMGTLKLRNNKKVTDRKQAIAIAISISMKECVMSKKDLKYIEKKIMKFLVNAKEQIPLTDVMETRILIQMYIKHKDIKKARELLELLIRRITKSGMNGINISSNIWKELNIILRML